MVRTHKDGAEKVAALMFLQRLRGACGPRCDELDVPIGELVGLTIADTMGDPEAMLNEPGARVRLLHVAARQLPAAERERVDGIDVIDTRAWPKEPEARSRFVVAFTNMIDELRLRLSGGSQLTPMEFAFMRVLIDNPGERCTFAALFDKAKATNSELFQRADTCGRSHEKAIKGLIGHKHGGYVVKGEGRRGVRWEFWAEPVR